MNVNCSSDAVFSSIFYYAFGFFAINNCCSVPCSRAIHTHTHFMWAAKGAFLAFHVYTTHNVIASAIQMNNGPFEPDPYKPNSSLSVSCTSGLCSAMGCAGVHKGGEKEAAAANGSLILI